jgi:hypothetical protein
MLAAGLFLMATGCGGPAATAPHPPPVVPALPATTGAAAAGFPADFVGVSPGIGTTDVVAVYSAADGRLIRALTVPLPGGGPGTPRLSPDGRTVIFARGQGSCARTIDLVPFRGGPEQVLVR